MISGVVLAKDLGSSAQVRLHQIVDVLIASRVLDNVIVLRSKVTGDRPDWFKGTLVENEMEDEIPAIVSGIRALDQKDLHGIILWPANTPPVSQKVIVDLLHLFWTRHKPIVAPIYEGRRGYPVIIGKEIFPDLEAAGSDADLETILWGDPQRVCEYQFLEKELKTNIEAAT